MTDHNKDEEGYEIKNSGFKVAILFWFYFLQQLQVSVLSIEVLSGRYYVIFLIYQ